MTLVMYLSGPMTGIPEFNYPEFARVSRILRYLGYKVESPHENPAPPSEQGLVGDDLWEYYMKLCKKQVERSEAIVLMQGWPESKGARLELEWALDLGHFVFFYDDTKYTLGQDPLIRMSNPRFKRSAT